MPLEDRLIIWGLVKAEQDGEVLLEVSDAVRQTLIEDMDSEELVAAAEQLDADEIADLAPDLPSDVMEDVFQALPMEEREQLRAAMSYSEDAVGALMDFDVITVRGDVRIEVVLRYLRRLGELPDHTDQLFVVDRTEQLQGVLLLNQLLVSDPEATVMEVMARDTVKFLPDDKAEQATHAFERYDLVTAPVISSEGKLLGRVTVNRSRSTQPSRSERRRRSVCSHLEKCTQPLGLASDQPGHGIHCFSRDRIIRELDRETGCTCCADAHCSGGRWKFR